MTQYTGFLKDGTVREDAYIVELHPPNKPSRRFLGYFSRYGWDHTRENCIYVGDSNGGRTYELPSADDSVIEGMISDYRMDDNFDTSFVYSEFEDSSVCKIIS